MEIAAPVQLLLLDEQARPLSVQCAYPLRFQSERSSTDISGSVKPAGSDVRLTTSSVAAPLPASESSANVPIASLAARFAVKVEPDARRRLPPVRTRSGAGAVPAAWRKLRTKCCVEAFCVVVPVTPTQAVVAPSHAARSTLTACVQTLHPTAEAMVNTARLASAS